MLDLLYALFCLAIIGGGTALLIHMRGNRPIPPTAAPATSSTAP